MKLIDTHAHLASSRFQGELSEIVSRAKEAGVSRIITIGSDLADSRRNLEIADEFDGVFASVGVHPTSVHEITQQGYLEELTGFARHPKVIAIGEIGLDFYHPPRDGSPEEEWRALQEKFFREQLDLAVELDLPVVIHQRNSAEAVNKVLGEYEGRITAVLHCFSGSTEEAHFLIDQGHYISFTGIVTFKNAREVQETAKSVPDDRIMVETDSPYLAPVPYRGKRCEPAYVRETASHIANLRNISPEDLTATTSENARRFFRLEKF